MIKSLLLKFLVIIIFFNKSTEQIVHKFNNSKASFNGIKSVELIPLYNGSFSWMYRSEIEGELIRDEQQQYEIIFKLYTKSNPNEGQTITINDTNSLKRSNFNFEHPTRIIIHGWQNDGNSFMCRLLCQAYLRRGEFNVIIVDWGSIAFWLSYTSVRNKVNEVAYFIFKFIEFLHNESKMNFSTLYLIGHSLGAHVAGITGKFSIKDGKMINSIIGLDPAGPLFYIDHPDERLSWNDAEYVETIHTNTANYGFLEPIGVASFYPNRGTTQPGCTIYSNLFGCSHSRAYEYFSESIEFENYFVPIICKDFENDLTNSYANFSCSQSIDDIRMGGDPSNYKRAKGIYYLQTNSEKPFGLGKSKLYKIFKYKI